jgi:hypothetical protein
VPPVDNSMAALAALILLPIGIILMLRYFGWLQFKSLDYICNCLHFSLCRCCGLRDFFTGICRGCCKCCACCSYFIPPFCKPSYWYFYIYYYILNTISLWCYDRWDLIVCAIFYLKVS